MKLKIIFGVSVLIIIIFAIFWFVTSPKYTDFDICPNCSANSSFITSSNDFFIYYCRNCDIVYTVTKSTTDGKHQFRIFRKNSTLYNSTLGLIDSRKELNEAYQKYQNATK